MRAHVHTHVRKSFALGRVQGKRRDRDPQTQTHVSMHAQRYLDVCMHLHVYVEICRYNYTYFFVWLARAFAMSVLFLFFGVAVSGPIAARKHQKYVKM